MEQHNKCCITDKNRNVENNMRIASFNVNSLRARLPIVLEWLAENKTDVLCMQETKVQDKDFPSEVLNELNYKYVFAGQKSYNGVAIVSNSTIEDVQNGFDDEPKDEPRLIKAKINGITILNTYIPQGYRPDSEKFQYKLHWFERFRNFLGNHFKSSDPILWLGDLNIAPEAIDVYDPKRLFGHVCFHPAVHEKLKFVMEWGFVDLFRLHNKGPGQYTFWDYRPFKANQNLGWRLDHIMATKPLAEKCITCYIDKKPRMLPIPSDHTPVIAEFNL